MRTLELTIRLDREQDGRWIAEVPELPGVLALAHTRDTALRQAKALALETLADLVALGDADIADAIHFNASPSGRAAPRALVTAPD
jgi:predicted RNase H-like HicB family nuclease